MDIETEASRAGYLTRLYVRGGMDPHMDEDALGESARGLLKQGDVFGALALIEGWVQSQDTCKMNDEPTRPVIWHRHLAGTRVVVTISEGAHLS